MPGLPSLAPAGSVVSAGVAAAVVAGVVAGPVVVRGCAGSPRRGAGRAARLAGAGRDRGEAGVGPREHAAAVEALWRSLGTDMHVAFWDRLLERYVGEARAALGPDADAPRARGLELSFDDAVALALR